MAVLGGLLVAGWLVAINSEDLPWLLSAVALIGGAVGWLIRYTTASSGTAALLNARLSGIENTLKDLQRSVDEEVRDLRHEVTQIRSTGTELSRRDHDRLAQLERGTNEQVLANRRGLDDMRSQFRQLEQAVWAAGIRPAGSSLPPQNRRDKDQP